MELFEEYWDSSKIATNRDMIGLAHTKPKILFNPGENMNTAIPGTHCWHPSSKRHPENHMENSWMKPSSNC